jgi:C4-dicarboxylate-specific signal transduction histidine kinase
MSSFALLLTTGSIIAAQSVLIARLLTERRRRLEAQAVLEEQARYERLVGDLTSDGLRYTLADSSLALEEALARIGRFAGASRAELVQYPECHTTEPVRLKWESASAGPANNGSAQLNGPLKDPRPMLAIPLVCDGARLGALALFPSPVRRDDTEPMATRLATVSDIIARAIARSRATRRNRRTEELNRAVLASLPTPMAILDGRGVIVHLNEAWGELAPSDAVSASHQPFLGENYLDECRRAEARGCHEAQRAREGIERVLKRRGLPFRYEYQISLPRARWYEMRVDPLECETGGAIVTHLDITDRRIAELQAEEGRRQVAHLSRLTMVGELAAAVSHELRQPLAAIRASGAIGARLLRRAPVDIDELGTIFRDIDRDDAHAAAILDHIRELVRKKTPITAPIDLNEVCRHAVRLLQRDAMLRRVELELVLEPCLPETIGDPVELQQVLINLMLNALDAAATSPTSRCVMVSTTWHHSQIEVTVRDSGPGVSPEVRQHLFESLFSPKRHGLGMGLSIVHSIVQRHRGRVCVENLAAGGAVFRVFLPALCREPTTHQRPVGVA